MSRSFNNNNRNNASAGTSFFEQLAYWVVKVYLYNKYDVLLHYKLDAYEFDIALPDLNIIIEVQSGLHINSIEMDKTKQNYCKEHNIRLITLMNYDRTSDKVQVNYQTDYIEVGCSGTHIRDSIEKVLLADNKLDFNKIKLQKNEHSRAIAATYALIMLITNQQVDIEQFCKLPWTKIWQTSLNKSVNAKLSFENSLASKDKLVKEYRGLVKYGYIYPREICLGSNEYANWECNLCGYKWEATVEKRTKLNRGCPKCAAEDRATCKDTSKSFFTKCKSLVPFIKANSLQEKELLAKNIYANSNVKTITLICPHCQKEKIIRPCDLQGATNVRCHNCKRLFIE